jgi:beta-glucanase (GH16 family)
VIGRRIQRVAVVVIALLASTTALARATPSRTHTPESRSVTTTISRTVTKPGRYLVVVSLRARRHADLISVHVTGRSWRTVRAYPRTVARLRYILNLTSPKLNIRAVSRAPAVRVSMKLTLKKPPTKRATKPLPKSATTTTTSAPTTPTPANTAAPPPPPAPLVANPYTRLVWSDEFSGPAGSPPDPAKWTAAGNSGCGGSTPTTNSAANAALDGNGHLALTAYQDGSSAQIDTVSKFSTTYGSVQASIELPPGDGLCSAFWMVGDGPNPPASCWPGCGEIDILEALSQLPNTAIFTLHGPTTDASANSQQFELANGGFPNLTAGFHTYGVIWTPDSFTWTVDGVAAASQSRAALEASNGPASWAGVYDKPFHLILDLAVGNWQMGPDANTPFPARMLVDWVHVYQ